MNEVKSIPELKKELKLNRWTNAKYKVLRNIKITGRILHLIYPFLLGGLIAYVAAGFVMDSFTFPFEEGTVRKTEEDKYVSIKNEEYKEGLKEPKVRDDEKNTITITEKPELLENGRYKVVEKIYRLEEGITEKESEGIKADYKNSKEFNYDSSFGKPLKFENEIKKPKFDRRDITANFMVYYELENYVKHANKKTACFSIILVGILFSATSVLFRGNYYFGDRIDKSIKKAKRQSGLKKSSKEIRKELRKRQKELNSIETSTYADVQYRYARLFGNSESESIILKEQKVYSKDGSLISNSTTELSTGMEVKLVDGLVLSRNEPLFSTSDLNPSSPPEDVQSIIQEYKNNVNVKSKIGQVIKKVNENTKDIKISEDLEDRAIDLLGKSRGRL